MTSQTKTPIQMAHDEVAGKGSFSVQGRCVTFRQNDGICFECGSYSTPKAAEQMVRILRAAPKYTVAA